MSNGKERSLTSREELVQFAHTLAVEAEVQQAHRGVADFDQKDIFQGLSILELYCLVEALSGCESVEEAYALLAQPTDDRQSNYYDRLIGPQHQIAYKGFAKVLQLTEGRKVRQAIDVGAGTGENTLTMIKHAEHVVAVDLSQPMLDVAVQKIAQRYGSTDRVETVAANILELTVPPGSTDFIVDNGLLAYLSAEEIDQYWQLVRSWLRPGGRYYTFDTSQRTQHLFETTLRGKLAGMAVQLVLRHSHVVEHQHTPPPMHLAKEYGFRLHLHKLQLEPFKAGVVQWTKI